VTAGVVCAVSVVADALRDLPADANANEVATALRYFGEGAACLDPIERAVARGSMVAALSERGVSAPARLVEAALASVRPVSHLSLVAVGPDPVGETQGNRPTFTLGTETELAEELLILLAEKVDGEEVGAVYDEGEVHAYDPELGIYRAREQPELSRMVQAFDGAVITGGDKKKPLRVSHRTVVGTIALARDRAESKGFFAGAVAGRAFTDGFLRETPEGLVLCPHAPEHRARVAYPFHYAERAEPAEFLTFLNDIFRDDADREERIAFVQEFGGAAAFGIATRLNRSGFFTSPGGGGRTQLGKILSASMPAGSVIGIKPQQFLNANRRALLVGKLLNIVDECPSAALLDADWFKQLCDGDSTDAEHKYGRPFFFDPLAAHLFFANGLPAVELTDAFFRRVVVLAFSRQFHKEGDVAVVRIAEQIIAAELPAIVSWFMAGADRLVKQGDKMAYTIPSSHEAEARRWRHESDSVAMFLIERTVLSTAEKATDGHDWTQATVLYEMYVEWAKATGHKKPVAFTPTFGARMKALGLGSESDGSGRFHRVRERRPAIAARAEFRDDKGKVKREARAAVPAETGPNALEALAALTGLTGSLQTQKPSLSIETVEKTNTYTSTDRLDRLSNGNSHREASDRDASEEKDDRIVKRLGPKARKVRQLARNTANGHDESLTGSPSAPVKPVKAAPR
jgi:hypothetical protein